MSATRPTTCSGSWPWRAWPPRPWSWARTWARSSPGSGSGWPTRACSPTGWPGSSTARRRRRRPADYPRLALAATTTHDLPTVAGFFTGSDLDHLCDIGVGRPPAARSRPTRRRSGPARRLLEDEGLLAPGERSVEAIVAALYASSPGPRACWSRPPSRTPWRPRPAQRPRHHRPAPNWSLPLPVPLDDLAADPGSGGSPGSSEGTTGRNDLKLRGILNGTRRI